MSNDIDVSNLIRINSICAQIISFDQENSIETYVAVICVYGIDYNWLVNIGHVHLESWHIYEFSMEILQHS